MIMNKEEETIQKWYLNLCAIFGPIYGSAGIIIAWDLSDEDQIWAKLIEITFCPLLVTSPVMLTGSASWSIPNITTKGKKFFLSNGKNGIFNT